MTNIDLQGWFAVADWGDETSLCEILGTVTLGDKAWFLVRDCDRRSVDAVGGLSSYELFMPGDRAHTEDRVAFFKAEAARMSANDDAETDDEEAA